MTTTKYFLLRLLILLPAYRLCCSFTSSHSFRPRGCFFSKLRRFSLPDQKEGDDTIFQQALRAAVAQQQQRRDGLLDARTPIEILLNDTLIDLEEEDVRILLNGVPQLFKAEVQRVKATGGVVIGNDEKLVQNIQALVSNLYTDLSSRGYLRGFQCILPGEEPVPGREQINPSELPELIGINQSALTPGNSGNIWTLAGVFVCAIEIGGASLLGMDPTTTVLPVTVIGFTADKIFLRGALFETCYRSIFPQYKQKVIRHEAAHFLVAYLLGCPIESCILSAWDAMVDPRFVGQAGTLFFDPAFSLQVSSGRIPRSTLDRYSMIVMAGIAGEALEYGKAEGGSSDEMAIIELLTSTNPPWSLERVRDQARWGVVQSALLLKEHHEAFEQLIRTLENGGGLGDCILSIEKGLKNVGELPVLARRRAQAQESRRVLE